MSGERTFTVQPATDSDDDVEDDEREGEDDQEDE